MGIRSRLFSLASQTLSNPTFTGTQIGNSYPLAMSAVAVSGAADTNENTLATITVPANTLGANGAIRLKFVYSFTSSANNKTWRVRFSGAAGTVYHSRVVSTQASETCYVTIANRNATNSQVGDSIAVNAGASAQGNSGAAIPTSAVDTTAQTTIVITAQKATAGETVTLESYYAEVIRLT